VSGRGTGGGRGRQAAPARDRALLTYAIVVTAIMFVVLVMGLIVTETDSGRGCGGTWPLCDGRLVPALAFHTLVEFSHRVVAGVEGVLIAILAIWAWWRAGARPEVRYLAVLSVAGVLAQAGLGAADVMFPESGAVLAVHFGVSLIAFAALLALTAVLWPIGRPAGPRLLRDRPVPPGMAVWAVVALGYVYALVYLGAYVAHVNAGLACAGWPLCNGAVVPAHLAGPTLVAYGHRLAALGGVVLLVLLTRASGRTRRDRPDLWRLSQAALGLILLQALSGAVLVDSRLAEGAIVLHGGLVTLLFGALSLIGLAVIPEAPRSGVAAAAADRRAAGG
jgi:cytochrome c oxidase assembly protein subunit 15